MPRMNRTSVSLQRKVQSACQTATALRILETKEEDSAVLKVTLQKLLLETRHCQTLYSCVVS